jgi:uncharacterized protein YceH (UPF0502 family)
MVQHELGAREARVLGVLIEKAFTTPEQYPLSLNATTAGANQKNNRDPVLELEQSEVLAALQKLIIAGLVGASHPAGGRVEKYRHNAQAVLELDDAQTAVVAELLLRGPQSPGELRGRASRMVPIDSLEELARLLAPLEERGLVARLAPAPGSRSERWCERLSPGREPAVAPRAPAAPAPSAPPARPLALALAPAPSPGARDEDEEPPRLERRVAELEHEVGRLRRQLSHLAWQLGRKLEG